MTSVLGVAGTGAHCHEVPFRDGRVSKIPAEGCTPEVLWDSAPKTIEAKK
jgi:hypothetical protein